MVVRSTIMRKIRSSDPTLDTSHTFKPTGSISVGRALARIWLSSLLPHTLALTQRAASGSTRKALSLISRYAYPAAKREPVRGRLILQVSSEVFFFWLFETQSESGNFLMHQKHMFETKRTQTDRNRKDLARTRKINLLERQKSFHVRICLDNQKRSHTSSKLTPSDRW